MFEFMTIRELYEIVLSASHVELDSLEYVQLQGWIRTNRCSGKLGFIELNDGTYFRNAQLVYMQELKNFAEVEKYPTGAAITVTGKLKLTPDGKQPFEIVVTEAVLEGDCDRDYPLQKKRHSFEYMREIPHLRPRANSVCVLYCPWPSMSSSRTRALSMYIRQSLPAMMQKVREKPLQLPHVKIKSMKKISLVNTLL